ncbi:odorant receptor 2a-like [Trichoplusia ni]|uniref:Odorant receptor n=1 Tax=Trichoplusia ni TaxID=7111 RepID=A0A7E5VUK4_TRINI|nr:odorant receptor 2a-like [Trichoplusia ni]
MELHQVDCFKMNMRFWKFLAIWPDNDSSRSYKYFSILFIGIVVILYNVLFSISFYFLPRQLDLFIEELIFYFTELSMFSKVMTFVFMRKKIKEVLRILETDIFQPDDAEGLALVTKAKNFIMMYYKIDFIISGTSNFAHVVAPVLGHVIFKAELLLPVTRYSFFSDALTQKFIYILYAYQAVGIHFHMLYNINIDTFFVGLMILIIAQLDVLDGKLRRVADVEQDTENEGEVSREPVDKNRKAVTNLNGCIIHFDEISRLCSLVEEIFSTTLFCQFSMASCIICVCLFRFTMPAPVRYYIFLATYMSAMMLQILIPCFFGTRLMDKSNLLVFSTYSCDWTPRSRQFKSNLRLFVERANKPLSLTGGKMFCLSLNSYTSIMNSAYSFFTLLQHMQTRE